MQRFKKIEDGVFIGPQPTASDLQEAKQEGVATVVDFRMPTETATSNEEMVTSCGLDYVSIPVDKEALSSDQIAQLDEVMRSKNRPFLLHCATGARAAMLYALNDALKRQASAQETFDAARSMGFDLQSSPQFASFVVTATAPPHRDIRA